MAAEQRDIARERDARLERHAFRSDAARLGLRGVDQRARDAAAAPLRRDRETADVKRVILADAEDAGDDAATVFDHQAGFGCQPRGEIRRRLLQHARRRIDGKFAKRAVRQRKQFAGARGVGEAPDLEVSWHYPRVTQDHALSAASTAASAASAL